MKTLTIEEAAQKLAALVDIETPDGDSSPEFRLRYARSLRRPDIETALLDAAMADKLRTRHPDGGYLPPGRDISVSSQVSIDEARAVLEADGWEFVSAATVKVGADKTAKDWHAEARRIADECFDRDTANNCRDSLAGYSRRVMEEMQKQKIHGPRGPIDNPNTIQREALQGAKWWAKKSK